MPRGGKRERAGRPKGQPMKVMRVPEWLTQDHIKLLESCNEILKAYQELIKILENYQLKSQQAAPTNVRWQWFRKFQDDVKEIIK